MFQFSFTFTLPYFALSNTDFLIQTTQIRLHLICGTNVGTLCGPILAIERREPVRRKRGLGVQSGG